jgi:glycosyltransferase involved in cell wall biosynthesis
VNSETEKALAARARVPVYALYAHPAYFTRRSGIFPLIDAVGAEPLLYEPVWERLQKKSWTLGHAFRRFGQWYFGSEWNGLVPVCDEIRFASRVPGPGPSIFHCIFAEFSAPRMTWLYRRKGARLVCTYHASVRKLPTVLGRVKSFSNYDHVVVVSATQLPFFAERGVAADRLSVIPLGVDTGFFRPPTQRMPRSGPLRALLVGYTERDHAFAAEVMKSLPPGQVRLRVRTSTEQAVHYQGVPGVELLPWMSDQELVRAYQEADVLLMPMIDCTANDAVLEAMACGTPVMVNRVGGIPEYVSSDSSFVLDGKDVGVWRDLLMKLAGDPGVLESRRAAVRAWAEQFDWRIVGARYVALYNSILP